MSGIAFEVAVEAGDWPPQEELEKAVAEVLAEAFETLALEPTASELSVLFTDDAAIRKLNGEWRGKDKPTNVLSFPAFLITPGEPLPPMLGDIVLAFETLQREAAEEAKPFDHHLRHLILHGLLHLLGCDHETDAEAEAMEQLEKRILERLAIPDPYG